MIDDVARIPTPVLAGSMIDALGSTLVAVMTGQRHRATPYKWRESTSIPRGAALERLQVAYRVWAIVTESDPPSVGRAWFIGSNPELGEASPIRAIRDGLFREVIAAARIFGESG